MSGPAIRPRDGRLRTALAVCGLLLLALAPPLAIANDAALDLSTLKHIEVQPQQLQLHRPRDRAMVLVTGYFPNGLVVDLTRRAKFASASPAVAVCQKGVVCPAGDGNCEIGVQVADQKASLSVIVDGFDRAAPISFRTETVAALMRQGCNSVRAMDRPAARAGSRYRCRPTTMRSTNSRSLARKKAAESTALNRRTAYCFLSQR